MTEYLTLSKYIPSSTCEKPGGLGTNGQAWIPAFAGMTEIEDFLKDFIIESG